MVAEIYAGLGAFKAMFDMAKGLKDINDAAIRNGAIIELQEQILSAQVAQTALLERIGELEKEVTDFETWETEKQRYSLKSLGYSAFAYMLKPDARTAEPPHWVCANCYQKHQISIIQYTVRSANDGPGFFCPKCDTKITPSSECFDRGAIKWLD